MRSLSRATAAEMMVILKRFDDGARTAQGILPRVLGLLNTVHSLVRHKFAGVHFVRVCECVRVCVCVQVCVRLC